MAIVRAAHCTMDPPLASMIANKGAHLAEPAGFTATLGTATGARPRLLAWYRSLGSLIIVVRSIESVSGITRQPE